MAAADDRAILLIVEDDAGVAELQRLRLMDAGYEVCVVEDAAQALERIRATRIDLLLLDQNLPGGVSGLDLYRQVRAAGLNLPAILVTAMTGDDIVLRSFREGVFDFIPKSHDYLDYLLPTVNRVLSNRRAQEERERLMREQTARQEAERARERMEMVARENARLYQEICKSDRLKDEFLAMLAHELRNPLAPIRNALHLIHLADPDGRGPQAGHVAVIDRQVSHLVRLVDDLLDVSRISQGKINLQKDRVELARILERAIESSQPLIQARRHRLSVELPAVPSWVEGDPVRLVQVFSNLLNNAAKYTPEGGRIELMVEVDGPNVQPRRLASIRVRDNGIGIAADVLPHLFDLFAQNKTTLDRADGGMGIGLTLVRQLTEMHGGTVHAHSEGPGKGSEFVVSLPLVEPPQARSASPAETPAAGAAVKRRVLIVDDNRDSAQTLAHLLTLLGNEVQTAGTGPEALNAANRIVPDMILLDIGLPGMDGLEVARRLRADRRFDGTVLVALTGYGSAEDRRQSQEAGFNAHLVKPVELEALKDLLAHPKSFGQGPRP